MHHIQVGLISPPMFFPLYPAAGSSHKAVKTSWRIKGALMESRWVLCVRRFSLFFPHWVQIDFFYITIKWVSVFFHSYNLLYDNHLEKFISKQFRCLEGFDILVYRERIGGPVCFQMWYRREQGVLGEAGRTSDHWAAKGGADPSTLRGQKERRLSKLHGGRLCGHREPPGPGSMTLGRRGYSCMRGCTTLS